MLWRSKGSKHLEVWQSNTDRYKRTIKNICGRDHPHCLWQRNLQAQRSASVQVQCMTPIRFHRIIGTSHAEFWTWSVANEEWETERTELSDSRHCWWDIIHRRKFRSQTSDNMDRWKSRGEKSPGGEEKKWEDRRRERERRKKMQVHEKVGKSRFTVFFQRFVAQEGRKVGSLKRRVRSQLARWEMKNCTPLRREAHFQVKSKKNWRVRTTFWRSNVEKVYTVVVRSTFGNQKCQKLVVFKSFLTFRCRKVHTD